MKMCSNCLHFRYLLTRNPAAPCETCVHHDHWQTTEQTHADRIRAKSDEELAEFFGTLPCCPPGKDLEELCFPLNTCEGTDLMVKCWLKWLRQEAEE